jgi:hypothetical protein
LILADHTDLRPVQYFRHIVPLHINPPLIPG